MSYWSDDLMWMDQTHKSYNLTLKVVTLFVHHSVRKKRTKNSHVKWSSLQNEAYRCASSWRHFSISTHKTHTHFEKNEKHTPTVTTSVPQFQSHNHTSIVSVFLWPRTHNCNLFMIQQMECTSTQWSRRALVLSYETKGDSRIFPNDHAVF